MPPYIQGIEFEPDCYNSVTGSFEDCDQCVDDSDCCSGFCYAPTNGGNICWNWYVEVVKTNSTESIMIFSNA